MSATIANIGSCVYKRAPLKRLNPVLRSKLPLNVLLVDGQCSLAVGHMVHALERNYSFSATSEESNSDMLLKNTLFFGSVNMADSKELTRNAVTLLGYVPTTTAGTAAQQGPSGVGASSSAASATNTPQRREMPSYIPPLPSAASAPVTATAGGAVAVPSFMMLIEQIPSQQTSAKQQRHGGAGERMFMGADGRAQGSSDAADGMDVLITTGGYAMIRMLMHLDRVHLRWMGTALWHACPHILVSAWTRRQEQLKYFHGRQPVDLFKHPDQQRGLRERVWTAQGVGTGKVKKNFDMSKFFDTSDGKDKQ